MEKKRILGLDLGTNSIGWALVESTIDNKKVIAGDIIKLGVRVNPLTTDEKTDFERGRPLSTNADRTLKRGARRNLQRYKLRREDLIQLMKESGLITEKTALTEVGKNTTHQTLALRAKAARERVELDELARILLTINKKRGYKSSRKAKQEDDGVAIDGMQVAKYLYDNELSPAEYVMELLEKGKKHIPDFYTSDLKQEFDQVWHQQKQYYPTILSDSLYQELQEKSKKATWAICKDPMNLEGIKLKEKGAELRKKKYALRVQALSEKIDLEHLVIVLQEINNDINGTSGYLGAISDRSKILYMHKKTVGEYLYEQICKNPHTSLKNQVFYRQDYMDEFERIWETQAKYHPELNPELKEEIRDRVIFYQRKLKSQKGLISFCEFESWQIVKTDKNGKVLINKLTGTPKKRWVGSRVIPKSSPLFQEFKIWQNINSLRLRPKKTRSIKSVLNGEDSEDEYILNDEQRQTLFDELNLRGNMTEKQVMKLLGLSSKKWKSNFPKGLEGNRTNEALYNVYQVIAEREGYGFDWNKKNAAEIQAELKAIFPVIGIDSSILEFDANKEGQDFDNQGTYQLWHLLYSAEEDLRVTEEERIIYGNSSVALKKKLHHKFGFKPEYAKMLANVSLQDDYGRLSAKAIRKIIPFLQDGHIYSEACRRAGYNHSHSLTKEELKNRKLKDHLELLPKNSLRNPVVEKILNQMVNVVNQIIDTYGKPDAVNIELARELKKSATERAETTRYINKATKANDEVRDIILRDFGFKATRSDLVRYKLWQELKSRGHKDLFTDRYIPREKIFSKEIDIEHIIPKALLFDDSYSNKTLAYREVNIKKGNRTGVDFMLDEYGQEGLENYIARVERLYKSSSITKGKYKKLLMNRENLPDGFIERDLRNTQYISKKAKQMLHEVFPDVLVTTGRITDKLRSDWDLINVMKELNLPKYRALDLTEMEKRWNSGQEKYREIEVIEDWTKRNDHRHHAMDALTVAFTTHNHIQYINNLNARHEDHPKHPRITAIENLIKDNSRFTAPIDNFRSLAKEKIEEILVSHKAKNKVVTWNINRIKKKGDYTTREQRTPRGQLHKETVYGKIKQPQEKPTKINTRFDQEQAKMIINDEKRRLVLEHLSRYENNPKKAFRSATLKKDPLLWKSKELKYVKCYEEIYTIRKPVEPGLNVKKVVDPKVREILLNRLAEYDGKAKDAFSNLEKNPIWLNKDKGIQIKRVSITGVSNVEALHSKKDHHGNLLHNDNGETIPVDYVSTGNNHHVAIYRDTDGKLQEQVVSFYEAVARENAGLPIIDKSFNTDKGWQFLFTMKQNEMFIFPSEDFDPQSIDLLDEGHAAEISKHLFRVQKISTKNYLFAHHLETSAITGADLKNKKMLDGKTYHSIRTPSHLDRLVKVRINHIGQIVQVGEDPYTYLCGGGRQSYEASVGTDSLASEPLSETKRIQFHTSIDGPDIDRSAYSARLSPLGRLQEAISLIKQIFPDWQQQSQPSIQFSTP